MSVVLVFSPCVEVLEEFCCQSPVDLRRVIIWDVEEAKGDDVEK